MWTLTRQYPLRFTTTFTMQGRRRQAHLVRVSSQFVLTTNSALASLASSGQKKRAFWDPDEERKLIELWTELIQETNRKMMTRKKKEALATTRLNDYIKKDLGKLIEFNEQEVHNKIDSMLKKGKQLYCSCRKTGEAVDGEAEIEIDLKAAESAWPNFKSFYHHFKDHPSLGPGSSEDTITPAASEEKPVIIAVDIDCSTAAPDNEALPPKKTPRIEKKEKASEKFLHNFSKIQEKT